MKEIDKNSPSKIFDDDDDELDLIKLVSTNANDSNQYLVFVGSNNELYAKNVSKIEELLIYKDLTISRNNDPDHVIVGTADIRGQMTTVVNFDRWVGNEVLHEKEYELAIIVNYGGRRFAIIVKSVEQITTIEPEEMVDNSSDNDKASFITKIYLSGKDRLCTVFDGDKMLLDIYEDDHEVCESVLHDLSHNIVSQKMVLFADDSKVIRRMVGNLFEKLTLNYHIYSDGKDMVEALHQINPDDIGLIITDIEMPQMGGREVIDHVRKDKRFDDINIMVHTNMSNSVMGNELLQAGTSKIIGKVDMEELSLGIQEYIR